MKSLFLVLPAGTKICLTPITMLWKVKVRGDSVCRILAKKHSQKSWSRLSFWNEWHQSVHCMDTIKKSRGKELQLKRSINKVNSRGQHPQDHQSDFFIVEAEFSNTCKRKGKISYGYAICFSFLTFCRTLIEPIGI